MNGWALFRAVLYCLPQKFHFIRKKCSWKNSSVKNVRGGSDNVFIERQKCAVNAEFCSGWMIEKNALLNINNKISRSRYLSLCALELVRLDKILKRISEEVAKGFLDYQTLLINLYTLGVLHILGRKLKYEYFKSKRE